MNVETKAAALVRYIDSLSDFKFASGEDETQGDMGAIITEAILQAGVRWETVVRPRVRSLRERYPEAATTSGFLLLLAQKPPHQLLNFKGKKPVRIMAVAEFFSARHVETMAELRTWLQQPGNTVTLKSLPGIGDKTADYFKLLVDIDTTAIDRHLRRFLGAANIEVQDYDEAHQIVCRAADLIGVKRSCLDHSIWEYMSRREAGGCSRVLR